MKDLEYWLSALSYESNKGSNKTGWFYRKTLYHKSGNPWAGTFRNGYRLLKVGKFSILEHRLVFWVVEGWLPARVDHRDGDTLNNHPENLRAAEHEENMANSKLNSRNLSGFKGVSSKVGGKFVAKIAGVYIGIYNDPESAARAYDREAIKKYKTFAKTNFKKEGV